MNSKMSLRQTSSTLAFFSESALYKTQHIAVVQRRLYKWLNVTVLLNLVRHDMENSGKGWQEMQPEK